VTELVRMGVRATLDPDRRPLGRSSSIAVSYDKVGNQVAREVVPSEPPITLAVVHFVQLSDGRRITTEAYGHMSLSVWPEITLAELRDELRKLIFEDEIREVDEQLAAEPRWEEMAEVLADVGVAADDADLAALPFVVELDAEVEAAVRPGPQGR
jgi:hypothetical protein